MTMKWKTSKKILVLSLATSSFGVFGMVFGSYLGLIGIYSLFLGLFLVLQSVLSRGIESRATGSSFVMESIKEESMELDEYDRRSVKKLMMDTGRGCQSCKKCWKQFLVATIIATTLFICFSFPWVALQEGQSLSFLITCWLSVAAVASIVSIPVSMAGARVRLFLGFLSKTLKSISDAGLDGD